tara:strand:+ start:3738 stop:4748 length:1011 start_codon:yes stop_codon:yes gene_type:complete
MIDFILKIFGIELTTLTTYKELYFFYKFLIFAVLVYNLIYNMIYSNKYYIGFIIFKSNYIIQYIILSLNLNKIENNENLFFILNYSQILIILKCICILYFNIKILNITNIYLNIIEFIGSYIYFNSITIFILLLIKIYQFIQDIHYSINNINDNELDIYEKLMINKYKISNIITNFNYIFNLFSLINIVCIAVCYENYDFIKNNIYLFYSYIIFITYFVLIEIICISIILYSRYIRENILSQLYSPTVVNNYIKKNDLFSLNNKFNLNIQINDIVIDNTILYNKINEIQKSNDWLILYLSLNNKWIEFKLCGIEIHSIDSIGKILLYSSILYKLLL